MAVASAQYEFTGGTTTTSQTGTSTGTGFQLGGAVTGFPDYLASGLVYSACAYYPRPYNIIVDNYSDVGFQQRMSVTDYVVNQQSFKLTGAWQRDTLAALCSDNSNDDSIFVDHFQFVP